MGRARGTFLKVYFVLFVLPIAVIASAQSISSAQAAAQSIPPALSAQEIVEFKARATKGDAAAQFVLGVVYLKGKGVPKNQVEAVNWFRKAAEQGYARAQFVLGAAYFTGEG